MTSAGFFTVVPQVRLPHPPVSIRIILTTHEAIGRAFDIIRADSEFPLPSAREDEITRYLHTILEDRFLTNNEVSGFSRRRIRNVVRAPEISNYDGTHPAKKPDLVMFLLRRDHLIQSSQDAVFAECKPVDSDHAPGSHYCDKGIARFVQGDYAWAMQDGMMIGYVRGNRTIQRDLSGAIAQRHAVLGSPDPPVLVSDSAPSQTEPLHSTTHQRSFAWPGNHGPACEIRLFHSWHRCS